MSKESNRLNWVFLDLALVKERELEALCKRGVVALEARCGDGADIGERLNRGLGRLESTAECCCVILCWGVDCEVLQPIRRKGLPITAKARPGVLNIPRKTGMD